MLRCAASFVTAAYEQVRRIPQDLRALPMNFLRNRLFLKEGHLIMRHQTFVLVFFCLLVTAALISCDRTQTQVNLPDLAPSSSDPSGSFCKGQKGPEKQLQLVVSVKNQGNPRAEASQTIIRFTTFPVTDVLLATPAIEPGATVTLQAVDVPKNCGSPECMATIVVDSSSQLKELNKNNNSLTCVVPLEKD